VTEKDEKKQSGIFGGEMEISSKKQVVRKLCSKNFWKR